nr:methionine aminopeptidase 1B, chloroplastic-like [Tanacetum cinerariifolium]
MIIDARALNVYAHRSMSDGDIMSIDVTVYLNGYHVIHQRHFLCGNVNEATKRLVKMDKASVLEDASNYIKELQGQVLELEGSPDLHMMALALELCCTLISNRRYGPTKTTIVHPQERRIILNCKIGYRILAS